MIKQILKHWLEYFGFKFKAHPIGPLTDDFLKVAYAIQSNGWVYDGAKQDVFMHHPYYIFQKNCNPLETPQRIEIYTHVNAVEIILTDGTQRASITCNRREADMLRSNCESIHRSYREDCRKALLSNL